MKSLAKDTVILAKSTNIVVKFVVGCLWCYIPTRSKSCRYGVVTHLYAWTSILIVALTYGMETGFPFCK